jgi:hypothetical protein
MTTYLDRLVGSMSDEIARRTTSRTAFLGLLGRAAAAATTAMFLMPGRALAVSCEDRGNICGDCTFGSPPTAGVPVAFFDCPTSCNDPRETCTQTGTGCGAC